VPTLSATRLVDLAFGNAQRITLKEGPVRDPDDPEQIVQGVELLALVVCLRRKTISLDVLTVLQYLRKSSRYELNLLLASCFTEAGFTGTLRHQPEPSSPQASHSAELAVVSLG
jgi:hypothetical protein